MTVLPLDQIPGELPTLISKLAPGEEIVLVDGDKPVARGDAGKRRRGGAPQRRRGTAKGILTIISEDHDHLKDFAEYME